MIKWYSRVISKKVKSIQFIITISVTLISMAAMVFVGGTLYNRFFSALEQNMTLSNEQILNQVTIHVEHYLNTMKQISDFLEERLESSEDTTQEVLIQQMSMLLNTREDLVTLALFTDTGDLLQSVPYDQLGQHADVLTEAWFYQADQSEVYLSSPHVQHIFEGQHHWVISLSRRVQFYSQGELISGVLLVDMNFSTIDELCRNVSLGKRGYVYILDEKNQLVYHPQQQLIHAGIKEEKSLQDLRLNDSTLMRDSDVHRLYTVQDIEPFGWYVVGVSYMDALNSVRDEMIHHIGQILMLGFAFFIFISVLISYKITKPIKILEKSMHQVQEGDFDVQIQVQGEEEVVQLAQTFNVMVLRIKQLMQQIVKEQEAKRKSELNALQAQINPHFLYNTLDSIVWMAENRKEQEVIHMVTALARLFRVSISKGAHIITVAQELEHAKNYLIIQKVRYKNRFQYNFHIDETVLNYKTLKLILQPLIENAIYHGIEYMVDEGLIEIYAYRKENNLIFEVRDNGLGMDPDTCNQILTWQKSAHKGSGVGVRNVHERIQLYFGDAYGLSFDSAREEGTIARIYLPIMEIEGEDEADD